jgi:hypothetical protein
MINSLALMSRWPGGAQKTPAKAPGKHGQPWPGSDPEAGALAHFVSLGMPLCDSYLQAV